MVTLSTIIHSSDFRFDFVLLFVMGAGGVSMHVNDLCHGALGIYSQYDERSPALITCRGRHYFEDPPHPCSGLRGQRSS